FSCPNVVAVRRALDQHIGLAIVDDGAPDMVLSVSSPKRGTIRIELSGKKGRMGRELRAPVKDCTALADTAALVVEAWRRDLPWKVSNVRTETTESPVPPPPARQLAVQTPAVTPPPTQLLSSVPSLHPQNRPLHNGWWVWTALGIGVAAAGLGVGLGV